MYLRSGREYLERSVSLLEGIDRYCHVSTEESIVLSFDPCGIGSGDHRSTLRYQLRWETPRVDEVRLSFLVDGLDK